MYFFLIKWQKVFIGLLLFISLISCGNQSSPVAPGTELSSEAGTSPLSPPSTPTVSTGVESSEMDEQRERSRVLAARFHGDWAPGYPYPVFFYELPYGETIVTLKSVEYSENEELLNDAHPRLKQVGLSILWPDGTESILRADNFVYDDTQGVLLTYNAYEDSQYLETYAVDVRASSGVGPAFLGDTSGINVFHNCKDSTVISREQLDADESDHPIESAFNWECEGDYYEMRAKMSWGSIDAGQNVNVITELYLIISREE